MYAIRRHYPTILHFGCPSSKEKGLEVFEQAVQAEEMIANTKACNALALRKKMPTLRGIVLNVCESSFSGKFYDNLVDGMPLFDSFDIASKHSRLYRLYGERDATKFFLVNPALHEQFISSLAEPLSGHVSKAQDIAAGAPLDNSDPLEQNRVPTENSAHAILDFQLEYDPGLERLLWLAVFARGKNGNSKVALAQILSQFDDVGISNQESFENKDNHIDILVCIKSLTHLHQRNIKKLLLALKSKAQIQLLVGGKWEDILKFLPSVDMKSLETVNVEEIVKKLGAPAAPSKIIENPGQQQDLELKAADIASRVADYITETPDDSTGTLATAKCPQRFAVC